MKVTCTGFIQSEDEFVFTVFHPEFPGHPEGFSERKGLTGEQIADLEDRKLVSCSNFEIAVFLLHQKHFHEDPADMLNKTITI